MVLFAKTNCHLLLVDVEVERPAARRRTAVRVLIEKSDGTASATIHKVRVTLGEEACRCALRQVLKVVDILSSAQCPNDLPCTPVDINKAVGRQQGDKVIPLGVLVDATYVVGIQRTLWGRLVVAGTDRFEVFRRAPLEA